MSYSRKPKRSPKGSSSAGKGKSGGGSSAHAAGDSGSGARVRMPSEHKPKVSQPGDAHEREAEAVADRVVSGGKAGPISSMQASPARAAAPEKKPEEKEAARQAKPEEEKKEAARAAAPETKPEEEKKEVARAAAPEAKPEEEKEVARAAPPETKPEEEKEAARAAAPETKPEEEKEVARAAAPEAKPEEEKEVARAATPESKSEDEKEPVARQAAPEQKPDEDKPVQRLVQRTAAPTEEKRPVARAASGGEGATSDAGAAPSPDVAHEAIASPGAGSPLDPSTRAALGPHMGTDLDAVRVHDDRQAQEAAAALDARAFTVGNDIWLGRGESQKDLRLMAHEVTHVAQQHGGASRMIQRATGGAAAPPGAPGTVEGDKVTVPGKGSIDAGPAKAITLSSVRVPSWKLAIMSKKSALDIPKAGTRDTDQASIWDKEVKPEIGPRTNAKLEGSDHIKDTAGHRIFFLEFQGGGGYVLGSKGDIKKRVGRPDWDKQGRPHFYDVDHKHEIQLGGDDAPANMWLLDAEANQTSGSGISSEISQKVGALLADARVHLGDRLPGSALDARKDYKITIDKVVGGLPSAGNPAASWEAADIESGKPLEPLKLLSEKEAKQRNLIGPGTKTRLMVFTSARGGGTATIPWDPTSNSATKPGPYPLYKHFDVDTVTWDGSAGSIVGTGFKKNRLLDPLTLDLPLTRHGAVEQAAVVSGRDVESKLRNLKLKGLSPITVEFAEMRDPNGIYMRGKVLPDVPLIAGAAIDLVADGNDVYLEKVFSTADFKFPGPIKVTEASLALAAGTVGLRVSGDVRFEITGVGKGRIGASGTGTAEGAAFALEGQFDFDSKLFDPAKIEVWYREGKFGGSGEIGVPAGKVKGLKSANVKVTFEEERIDAKGTFEPDVKGVERGDLAVTYQEGTGLQIAGTLQLSKDVPGLKSGTIEASVNQKGEEWSLGGAISAEAGIPGVTATITGSYEDGGWQAEGSAGYEKGMLKGTVTIGATNRAVGDDGRPSGEGTDTVTAYGGGEVTIKLAPWLQGTVGLKIKPDGNVVVSGKVGLPSAFELFEEKKVEKNIFSINIDIPIVGFSVAGQRVGIFATIGGGLDAEAAIGPGQLKQAELGVTYDPADESATVVTGAAQLFIPARAGLRLFVRGGIGAGIPLVSATAGLELGGRLGVEAALQSDLQVNWTPAQGLVLDTVLQAYAQPTFKFDVTGFVEVTFDYLVGEETLYEKRWQLAAIEYGSGLRFGLKLPVHYEEGKAFDVSLSDVEFEYPQIDPGELLAGLVKQFA